MSIVQHPQGAAAPAPATRSEDRGEHPLGIVPHQIRGFLSTFENVSIVGKSYNCCSACSDNIVNAYKAEGWDFVQKALNETGYVEELSGLKEVCHFGPFPLKAQLLTARKRSRQQQKQRWLILIGMKHLRARTKQN